MESRVSQVAICVGGFKHNVIIKSSSLLGQDVNLSLLSSVV